MWLAPLKFITRFMFLIAAIVALLSSVIVAQAPVGTGKTSKPVGSKNGASSRQPPKPISIAEFQVRVSDELLPLPTSSPGGWSGLPGFEQITYRGKCATPLKASDDQRLQLSFSIVEAGSSTKLTDQPHQVFIRLASDIKEVILLAEYDKTHQLYKLDFDIKAKARLFDSLPGRYELSLIVGDTNIEPLLWVICDQVEFTFAHPGLPPADYHARLPDIVHMFRPAEKRPPEFVSNAFSVAVAALFGLMLVLWSRIGIRLSGITPSSLLFHLSLVAIFYIEYLFYSGGQNMFVTLRYLSWATPLALFFGRRMLAHHAKLDECHRRQIAATVPQ